MIDCGKLARFANIFLGIWLMAAPAVLGYGAPAAVNDRSVGPLVVTFATVAIWEVTRAVRRVNLVLGAWLMIAPWLLGYPMIAVVNSVAAGVLVTALATVHGQIKGRFGGGWSVLWATKWHWM